MLAVQERQVNIKDLGLFEPRVERPKSFFDPSTDISSEEWEMISNRIREREASLSQGVVKINPAFLWHLGISAPEKIKKSINENLVWNAVKVFRATEYSDATLKALFPEKAKQENLVRDLDWELIKDKFDQEVGFDKIFISANVKILSPERQIDFEITDEVFQSQKTAIEELEGSRAYRSLAIKLIYLKIASAERYSELGLDDERFGKIWTGLNKLLDKYRGNPNEIEAFFEIASFMAILSADEIQITDNGVKLIFPEQAESFNNQHNPTPNIRRF